MMERFHFFLVISLIDSEIIFHEYRPARLSSEQVREIHSKSGLSYIRVCKYIPDGEHDRHSTVDVAEDIEMPTQKALLKVHENVHRDLRQKFNKWLLDGFKG